MGCPQQRKTGQHYIPSIMNVSELLNGIAPRNITFADVLVRDREMVTVLSLNYAKAADVIQRPAQYECNNAKIKRYVSSADSSREAILKTKTNCVGLMAETMSPRRSFQS